MLKNQVRALAIDFSKSKNYIVTASVIFVLSMVLGYQWQAFHTFLQGQIEGIAEIAQRLAQSDNPMLDIFIFIFLNNTIKSIAIVYLGFFMGVLPLIFLVINGMVLGYLYLQFVVVQESTSLWEMLIAILPHGIIELPAVVIACAYGMQFGMLIWKRIVQLLANKPIIENEIKQFLQSSVRIVVFLIISLLIAAVIETVITPWLMTL